MVGQASSPFAVFKLGFLLTQPGAVYNESRTDVCPRGTRYSVRLVHDDITLSTTNFHILTDQFPFKADWGGEKRGYRDTYYTAAEERPPEKKKMAWKEVIGLIRRYENTLDRLVRSLF